jgi:hypothetical protein
MAHAQANKVTKATDMGPFEWLSGCRRITSIQLQNKTG